MSKNQYQDLIWVECETQGEQAVRQKIAMGLYNDKQRRYVDGWLVSKDHERSEAERDATRSSAREANDLALASNALAAESNVIARSANSLALTANETADEALGEVRNSTTIARLTLIMAIAAMAMAATALIGMLLK